MLISRLSDRRISGCVRLRIAAAWLLSVAFISLFVSPARAYRTGADLLEIEDDAVVRWDGSIRLSLNRTQAVGFEADEVVDAIEEAMATWADPACARIDWNDVEITSDPAQPDDGKSVVQWVTSGWQQRGFDASESAITDVRYERSGERWRIVEVDIYLNADTQAFGDGEDERALLAVMTHELGHVLGLLHPCELDGAADPSAPSCEYRMSSDPATMYPGYAPAQSTLEDDDISGVCFLYPSDGAEPGPSVGDPDAGVDAGLADAGTSECGDAGCSAGDLDFGIECAAPEECASGHCLERSSGTSVCTRECSMEHACPQGWKCAAFDDSSEHACVPREDDGCSVSRVAPARTPSALTGVVFSVSLGLWRFRRRQKREPSHA